MSELEIIFPQPVAVRVGRRQVQIRPVQLRHFQHYGAQASALIELFASMGVQQINRYAERNARDIRRLLLATTSLKRWQLLWMPTTVAVQLVAEVIRVNSGFCGEALPQVVSALAGPASSSASPAFSRALVVAPAAFSAPL